MANDDCIIIPADTSLKDNATFVKTKLSEALGNINNDLANKRAEYLIWILADIEKFEESVGVLTEFKDKAEAKDNLFKISHNMQGEGGMYGYPLVTEILFFLNKYIETNQNVTDNTITIIKLHIQAVKTVIRDRLEGPSNKKGERLIEGLMEVIEKLGDN